MASFTDQSTIQKIKSIYNLGPKNKELGCGAFGVVYLSHVANNVFKPRIRPLFILNLT